MKKTLLFALMAMLVAISCNRFDDSAIWDKLREHEKRIAYLEESCKQINTDIATLQNIVAALESSDYIVNAYPLASGDGYTLVFKSGKSIVIRDGKDGVAPIVSVRQDDDGVYYWTINGEWLLADGAKVIASSSNINNNKYAPPMFRIEDSYWYISCDYGVTWEKFCLVAEDAELNSNSAYSLFKEVIIGEDYIQIILNDDEATVINLPFYVDLGEVSIVELEGEILEGNINTGGGITPSTTVFYKVVDITMLDKSTTLYVESTSNNQYTTLWALYSEPYKNSLQPLLAKGGLTSEMQSDSIDLSIFPTATILYVAVGSKEGLAKITYEEKIPTAYDEIMDELIALTNKPAISWIDDDFTGVDYNGNISEQYSVVHNWCVRNDIKCDFAIIPDAPLSSITKKIEVAKQWEEDNFHFLFHPVHSEGWYNYSQDKPHDIEAVKKSIVTGLRRLREYGLLCPLDMLVWPGNSHTFDDNIEVVKNYMDVAISVTQGVNHAADADRYKIARISIERLNKGQTVSDIKRIIDNAVERGDWLIFYTHIHSIMIADNVSETGFTTANLFELLRYANEKVKLRPTEAIWRERRIMWEYSGK